MDDEYQVHISHLNKTSRDYLCRFNYVLHILLFCRYCHFNQTYLQIESQFQLQSISKATVISNLAIYGAICQLHVGIWFHIIIDQFSLLQGTLESHIYPIWFCQTSISFDEIHLLLPVPHNAECHIERFEGCTGIDWHAVHQQNVTRSESNMQSSQTLQVTAPVLPNISSCSQTPLELSNVLWDSARAFSGAPESTGSYGGAFGCYEIWLTELSNFGAPETSAQICGRLQEQLGPLRSSAGDFESTARDLKPYSRSSCDYISTRHFILSYSSLLRSQDLLHQNMACII